MRDKLLKLLLAGCLVLALISLIAFANGHDWGFYLIFITMAVATFPLFHFASVAPLKRKKKAEENRKSERSTTGED